MGNNNLLVQNIKNILGTIQYTISYNYDKTLKVSLPVSELYDAVCLLSNNSMLNFDVLTDIVGVDNLLRKEKRFEVIYILTSINNRERIMLSVSVSEGEAIPSLSTSFDGANWLEREVWDMFGIPFSNHPDLRRLLSDYGFRGHPLRKDFPLYGYVETRYDEETKKVIYEPVFLEQDFRNFETQSPWEGVPLSGDEKANVNLEGKE